MLSLNDDPRISFSFLLYLSSGWIRRFFRFFHLDIPGSPFSCSLLFSCRYPPFFSFSYSDFLFNLGHIQVSVHTDTGHGRERKSTFEIFDTFLLLYLQHYRLSTDLLQIDTLQYSSVQSSLHHVCATKIKASVQDC